MSTLSESSSEAASSPPNAPVAPLHRRLSNSTSSCSRSSYSRSSYSRLSPRPSSRTSWRWQRLGALVGALLLMVSCMPAHVASDTARESEARNRPSKTYHVQVRTVEAKSEADEAVTEVMTWFDGLDRDERPLPLSRVSTVPVDVRWKAPFYRVRVGPFTSKEAAESVLQSVQRKFPDAFIAKEIIEDEPATRRTFWYESPRSGTMDDWNRERDWSDDRDKQREREWDRDDWQQREDRVREEKRWEDVRRDRLEQTRDRLERERQRRDREWERRREQWEREREQARRDGSRDHNHDHDDSHGEGAEPNAESDAEPADEHDEHDDHDDGGW